MKLSSNHLKKVFSEGLASELDIIIYAYIE